MSTKRFLFVLVACALVSIAALAGWRALPSQKVVADRTSKVDSSYDAIEKMRAKQYAMHTVRSTSHLAELERIKDALGISNGPISASHLEELEQIKDALALGIANGSISASHLEELEQIKDTLALGIANGSVSASHLEELERIKGTLGNPGGSMSASHLEELEQIKGTLGNPDDFNYVPFQTP